MATSSPTPTQSSPSPPHGRIDIGAIRREQIVEAAVGIIVRQGLHNLSLSKIEQAAGMKRGQLTYYFPTKEDILLAVFDRLLLLMYQRMEAVEGPREERLKNHTSWECVQGLLQMVLRPPAEGDLGPEFHALQHTCRPGCLRSVGNVDALSGRARSAIRRRCALALALTPGARGIA
ncbi:MAG: TetR/AcrR family transcriptional regulator [Planctomycetes bacterium]|nr:TetR/AcrR family transcriptional regulator [Planctomycetota bacterium]